MARDRIHHDTGEHIPRVEVKSHNVLEGQPEVGDEQRSCDPRAKNEPSYRRFGTQSGGGRGFNLLLLEPLGGKELLHHPRRRQAFIVIRVKVSQKKAERRRPGIQRGRVGGVHRLPG